MHGRQVIQRHLEFHEGISGATVKLEIGTGCCYLKYGEDDGKLCWVDLTLSSKGDCHDALESGKAANVSATKLDNNKSLVEVACRQATVLLQCGQWGVRELVSAWRGTHFDPFGVCPQVMGNVSSPFDAAARYFDSKFISYES